MLFKPPRNFSNKVRFSKVILTGIQKRNYQRKICSADQMNISKPLTRAQLVASELDHYYYKFPKIPRPKRNLMYYYSTRRQFQASRPFSTKVNVESQKKTRQRKRLTQIFTLTSISVILYGIANKIKADDEAEIKPTRDHSWKFYAYSTLPLKSISRLWGKFNAIELPVWLRTPGYKFYSSVFGVNLSEMEEQDLTKYKNLGEFFYRSLKPGVRPLLDSLLVSPCDGRVLKFGIVENGEIEQVKGITYSVNSLLGSNSTSQKKKSLDIQFNETDTDKIEHVQRDEEFAQLNGISYTVEDLIGGNKGFHFNKETSFETEGDAAIRKASSTHIDKIDKELQEELEVSKTKLFFTVIYLAPGDYHRFHSPVNWVTTMRRHFIGELYSVAPYFQETLKGLFVLNERVSLLGYWKYGFFSMTPVGATNVGSIKINFDRNLTTNSRYEDETNSLKVQKNTCYEASYAGASRTLNGVPLLKGEEVGGFKLGSTVVLVFEAPENFKFELENGQYLRMGEKIGDIE